MSPARSLFATRERREILLEGAAPLVLLNGWLDPTAEARLFDELFVTARWERPVIHLYGKVHTIPRATAWFGDAVYCYSGMTNTPSPWTATLAGLRRMVEQEAYASFNSVLANLYRTGMDHVSWHADDEQALGHDPVIASLSLGAPRRFLLRKTNDHAHKVELLLEPGSLLLMGSGTQRHWQHSLPIQRGVAGPRINLTWRSIDRRSR